MLLQLLAVKLARHAKELGVAVIVFVLQYAQFELHYDSFFKEGSRIYRVTTDSYDNQQRSTDLR